MKKKVFIKDWFYENIKSIFSPSNKNRFHHIAILILIGSSNPIAIKYALNYGWTPVILGLFRMGIITFFLVSWLSAKRESLFGKNRKALFYSSVAALCKGLGVICFYIALSKIPAYRSVILSAFSPVVSLILIHFILEHEEINRKHIAGIIISLAGMYFLIKLKNNLPEENSGGFSFLSGDMLMIISIIFHNAMVVFEKKSFYYGIKSRQLVVLNSIVSLSVFLFMFIYSEEQVSGIPVNSRSVGILLYLVTVSGVFLFIYRRWIVSNFDMTFINSFSHAGKALSIFYAALILGESISLQSIIYFCLILSGTWIAAGKRYGVPEG